jgi:hypothetical protein
MARRAAWWPGASEVRRVLEYLLVNLAWQGFDVGPTVEHSAGDDPLGSTGVSDPFHQMLGREKLSVRRGAVEDRRFDLLHQIEERHCRASPDGH